MSHTASHTEDVRSRFGGVKIGCAFLGFTSAYGLVVLISSVVGTLAVTAGLSLGSPPGLADLTSLPADFYTERERVLGYVAGLAALLVAYYVGGYVAGRMARFDGVRQGVAVWGWGVLVSLALALLALGISDQLDLLTRLPGRIYLGVAVALAVQLVGAVLGGLAGMRFHRAVDRATPATGTAA